MTWKKHLRNALILLLLAGAGGYWYLTTPDKARLPLEAVQGWIPQITEPRRESFPTIRIGEVIGWKAGEMPTPAQGFKVQRFAGDLDHPRWLHVLENGDVLVAESNAPDRPVSGIEDRIARKLITAASGSGKPRNRITLLRDADGDGVAEARFTLLEAANGLNSPFGMHAHGGKLYVANTDAVLVFPFKPGETRIDGKGQKLIDLPANLPNNHWARNLIVSKDGKSLFVTIGSNSNIGENGMEGEKGRAQIKEIDLATGEPNIYAYGLRNPNGLAFNPISGTLWTTVNERDMLGSDLPPDYMSTVDFGTFYGWPYYYWGKYEDPRVEQTNPTLKQYSKRPDYALGPHVAALGLVFTSGPQLGANFANGAFVALHGSWNRYPPSGYKVIYVPFNERGFPVKDVKPVDVLTGFMAQDQKKVRGRPAGLALDKAGALLVADDSGNSVWRLTAR